jgi:BolA protein
VNTGLSEADIPQLNPERIARMRVLLTQALEPSRLAIRDDSHKHAGHAGSRQGHGHFSVAIESAAFAGQRPLARHRLVYAALGEMMQTDIHALSITAATPEQSTPDALEPDALG